MPPRRSFSRFRRFRRGSRAISARRTLRPTRWSVANFSFVGAVNALSGVTVTQAFEVMKIPDHVGDETTTQGQTLNAYAKAIEIGGVVWDADAFMNQSPVAAVSAHMLQWFMICVSRLDLGNSPSGVGFDPFNTQKPVATLTVAQPATNLEADYPDRILHREFWTYAIGANDTLATSQGSIRPSGRGKSLRLRIRLDDLHGLYFYFASHQSTGSTVNTTHVASGSLYYRLVFGRG